MKNGGFRRNPPFDFWGLDPRSDDHEDATDRSTRKKGTDDQEQNATESRLTLLVEVLETPIDELIFLFLGHVVLRLGLNYCF